jgi:hypothetical protein
MAIAVVMTTIASGILAIMFRLSVKREATPVYEALWQPVLGGVALRFEMVSTYLKMIYLREYRVVLAAYPRSRAWASWMFAVNWLQLAALVGLVLVTLGKA